MTLQLDPHLAWERLPDAEWNDNAARHLLRRAGWAATAAEVARARTDGLDRTLERLFPAAAPRLPQPQLITELAEDTPEFGRRLLQANGEEKRMLLREARERTQTALQDLSLKWLQFAARPDNASSAKWVLFLSDVYVVASDKVRNPALLWKHFEILSEHAFGPAPALTKAISRSPAMIRYLDLNDSKRTAPNENFARELFELFLLGEGHYGEPDIKEAARAFTGYRVRFGSYFFAARDHDATAKTVFGRRGNFSGDDIVDLAYRQTAARTFLPQELAKFYLTDVPLPREFLAPLGDWWAAQHFDLRALAHRFFGSQAFYAPEFSGDFIKSPVHFYLGLLQDLELDVTPIPRRVLAPLRQMGQMLYNPPNVRGWVGGRNWINSATLAARRQLVEELCQPLREDLLNADDVRALDAARAAGAIAFSVMDNRLVELANLTADATADSLVRTYLPRTDVPTFRADLRDFLQSAASAPTSERVRQLRRAIVAVLQSPEYQLC